MWSATLQGNHKLNTAYTEANQPKNKSDRIPIYLFFSISSGGYFTGVAKMTSQIHPDLFFTRWVHYQVWKGLFEIEWISVKDIPNRALNHITNKYRIE